MPFALRTPRIPQVPGAIAASALVMLLNAPALAPADTQAPIATGRPEQKIQRIRTEDAGSRIDEVRVGGQTQSIVVQPKTGTALPAYEVNSADTARGAAPSSANSDTLGARVWNVLKF